MKRLRIIIGVACAALGFGAPAYAASHFTATKYAAIFLKIPDTAMSRGQSLSPEGITLTSGDDRTWELKLGNCALDISGNGPNLTPGDKIFKSSFESGYADNPASSQLPMIFSGRADGTRPLSTPTALPLTCDAKRTYWIYLMRFVQAPGTLTILVMDVDGYGDQEAEGRFIAFTPDNFMEGDNRTADQIGGITAAIAQSMQK